jgi:hypothetical protein
VKYGYMHSKNGKYELFVPHVEEYSSPRTASEVDNCSMKDEIRVDEIKAKATSVPLHLTLG